MSKLILVNFHKQKTFFQRVCHRFVCLFVFLGMESRASDMLGTCSTTDMCLQIATINLKMNLRNEFFFVQH